MSMWLSFFSCSLPFTRDQTDRQPGSWVCDLPLYATLVPSTIGRLSASLIAGLLWWWLVCWLKPSKLLLRSRVEPIPDSLSSSSGSLLCIVIPDEKEGERMLWEISLGTIQRNRMGMEIHKLPLWSRPVLLLEDTIAIDREDMALWSLCGDTEVIKITGRHHCKGSDCEYECVYQPPAAVKRNQRRPTCAYNPISHRATEIDRQAIRREQKQPTLFVIGSCPWFEVRSHS